MTSSFLFLIVAAAGPAEITSDDTEAFTDENRRVAVEGGLQIHAASIGGKPRTTAGVIVPVGKHGAVGLVVALPLDTQDENQAYGMSALWRRTLIPGPVSLFVEPSVSYRLLGGNTNQHPQDVPTHLLLFGVSLGTQYQINPHFSVGGRAGADVAFQNPGAVNSMRLGELARVMPRMDFVSAVYF